MTNHTPFIDKGNRLRKIVDHIGITQSKFSDAIGISQGYLTQIINGHKDLSGTFLEGFAHAYSSRYNILWLLTGKGSMLVEYELHSLVSPEMVEEPGPPVEKKPKKPRAEPNRVYADEIGERILMLEARYGDLLEVLIRNGIK